MSDVVERLLVKDVEIERLRALVTQQQEMLVEQAKTIRDKIASLERQGYTYIGKDGKPITARELEDQRDEARALLAEANALSVSTNRKSSPAPSWPSVSGVQRRQIIM